MIEEVIDEKMIETKAGCASWKRPTVLTLLRITSGAYCYRPSPSRRVTSMTKGYAAKAFTNEYHWLFHLNEIPIPSITLPTFSGLPGVHDSM